MSNTTDELRAVDLPRFVRRLRVGWRWQWRAPVVKGELRDIFETLETVFAHASNLGLALLGVALWPMFFFWRFTGGIV